MPWIYNPTRDVRSVTLLDGTAFGFLPRKRVFVQLDKMSAELWRLIQSGKLVNQGGDPVIAAIQVAEVRQIPVEQIQPSKPDTSSIHHESDARVTVDSSNASGEKESKSVKKQDDDLEKVTSGGPEAVIQSNDTKKTEKRGGSSRKRT